MLTQINIRRSKGILPGLENDQLAGIISIGDVVKAIIAEQEYTIKHLENYITGGR